MSEGEKREREKERERKERETLRKDWSATPLDGGSDRHQLTLKNEGLPY